MNTEWKPIASAPKDGSSVLLRGKGDHRIADGYWLQAAYNGVGAWVWPYVHSEPVHWMPLPAEPCLTCNGHGMIGGLMPHSGYDAEPCPDCTPAPTSHPIPTGATGERDWELACDECNGSGHVFVKHQVAERKTDVQEFKEECEACEGRGFNIAFEDIPGIAEYVKSCWAAPAAGDALDVVRLRRIAWLIGSIFVHGNFQAETFNERELEKLLRENGTFWDSLAQFDAALAAIAQQKGEA